MKNEEYDPDYHLLYPSNDNSDYVSWRSVPVYADTNKKNAPAYANINKTKRRDPVKTIVHNRPRISSEELYKLKSQIRNQQFRNDRSNRDDYAELAELIENINLKKYLKYKHKYIKLKYKSQY